MATLYSIAVAADDRARGQVEHGHDVAHRVYSLRRTRLFLISMGGRNRRRVKFSDLFQSGLHSLQLERHADGLEARK